MRTTVTARHCEISEDLRARAASVVEKTAKIASRAQSAEVIFNVDHGVKVIEMKLMMPRGQVRIATAEADDFRTALDRAAAKIRNQLKKDERRASRRPIGE